MHCLATALLAAVGLTGTLAAPALAQTADGALPSRRPGQWETRMTTEKPAGGPQITAQTCIDAATDRELMEFGLKMSKDSCKRYELKKAGAGWTVDSDCAFGPVKTVSRTTITGDFKSTVHMRIEGTTDGMPGAKGPQPTLMTHTARFVSATCADGMKPGDISMGNGIKMNIKQMKSLQKLLPQLQIR